MTSPEDLRVTKVDALFFAVSLEGLLLQMQILDGTAELRALRRKPKTKMEKLQRQKLHRDRDMVKSVIRSTLVELAETGGWSSLVHASTALEEMAYSPVNMRLQDETLRMSRANVSGELEENRFKWSQQLKEADKKIAILRDKIKDDHLNAAVRLSYADRWLNARLESAELAHQPHRGPLPNCDCEKRVHHELLRAYQLQIEEREKSLEYWQQKYSKDIVQMNERLVEKGEQLRLARERRGEFQKLYDLHNGEMQSWLTFKREREARLLREERSKRAATSIQAWWRGVMVRRGLGAFKNLRSSKKSSPKNKKK